MRLVGSELQDLSCRAGYWDGCLEKAFNGLWFRSEGYGAKEECVDTG
jgi:hypothetical protein